MSGPEGSSIKGFAYVLQEIPRPGHLSEKIDGGLRIDMQMPYIIVEVLF